MCHIGMENSYLSLPKTAPVSAKGEVLSTYETQNNVRISLGSRDGAVVRALASHQCGPGSILGVDAICGLSLLLVPVLAPRTRSHSVEATEIPIY